MGNRFQIVFLIFAPLRELLLGYLNPIAMLCASFNWKADESVKQRCGDGGPPSTIAACNWLCPSVGSHSEPLLDYRECNRVKRMMPRSARDENCPEEGYAWEKCEIGRKSPKIRAK